MRKFEYKAVPAPSTGTKAKTAKTTGDRFALSLTDVLNEMAAEGWEYVRAETLPCTERKGLTGTQQTYQNILVFRRLEAKPLALAGTEPRARPAPSLQPVPDAPEVRRAPTVDAPRITSRPPDEGVAPTIRAVDD